MSKETKEDLKYALSSIVLSLIGIGTAIVFTGFFKHVDLLDEVFMALFATDIIYAIYQLIYKAVERHKKNNKKE